MLWDWLFWARPAQKEPEGDWLTWLILAGRGFGKTRTGAETIRDWACGKTPLAKGRYRRFLLIAETAADARDVMVEGESGLLSVHPKAFRPLYEPSKRRLTWPNGAVASLFNATEPDQLRGPQGDAAWCDELAKWQYARETWDMLQFGLRLGNNPRQIVTTTPRPVPVVKELLASSTTVVTRGSTLENRGNLAPSFLRQITARYEGTRLGRQELNAEVLDDNPNALWTRAMIEAALTTKAKMPEMGRIVVAIDPSGSDGKNAEEEGDDIGIICAGKGVDGRLYILADKTINASPAQWGKVAVELYRTYRADLIVAERNFGGAMVEHVIRSVDPDVPYKEVTASRAKWVRAEPVAALYEQSRVSHVGSFASLEDEMCAFGPDGLSDGKSPNRMDALVWAAHELMLNERSAGALPRTDWQRWEQPAYPACSYVLAVASTGYAEDAAADAPSVTFWGMFTDGKSKSPKVMLLYAWSGHVAGTDFANGLTALCGGQVGVAQRAQFAKKMAVPLLPSYGVKRLLVVSKGDGSAAQRELGRLLQEDVTVELIDPKRWGDAAQRLQGIGHMFTDGAVYAPDRKFAKRVINAVAEFPNSADQGLVNTTSTALLYMRDIGLLVRSEEHEREEHEQGLWRGRSKPLYAG